MLEAPAAAWIFLAVSVVGGLFTLNAFSPVRRNPLLFIPSFFASLFTIELTLHHIAWQAVATGVFALLGAFEAWPGWLGLLLTVASWVGLVVLYRQGQRAGQRFADALDEVAPNTGGAHRRSRRRIHPFSTKRPGIRVERDILYRKVAGQELKLDVVAPRHADGKLPAILQIHGGSWVIGDKRHDGWPLMTYLASNGWVCVNANYRLSPGATFPDHLVDLKQALVWIREHAEEWNIDPSFVAVTGGSAGGHLATMLALTQRAPELQPGFEEADTSVQAAVSVYGVYDFIGRLGQKRLKARERMAEKAIIKAFLDEEPDKFRKASPMDHVDNDAPPFFIVHGDRDTVAPVVEARHFAKLLRDHSKHPVVYAELPGAQHAFDHFNSPRTAHMVAAVLRFLDSLRSAAIG